jgi:hypothetical protein
MKTTQPKEKSCISSISPMPIRRIINKAKQKRSDLTRVHFLKRL